MIVAGLVPINSLIHSIPDSSSGILKYEFMTQLFREKNIEKYTSLVFQFLHQYEVILPIDAQSALVPSFLYHIPMVSVLYYHYT